MLFVRGTLPFQLRFSVSLRLFVFGFSVSQSVATYYALALKSEEYRDEHHRVVVVVFVLTLTRIIKSVVAGQAPVTLELRNTPGKNTN